ncbi:MAG: RecX family transcriptional regulator [Bacteroidetes bacterium]|nr:RecX family transcriptional regulator [Bacteroidota bacterium]
MAFKKQLTKEQALQKAKHYCGYQERSHAEVREKLYSFGLRKQEVEESLSQLIGDDYLNEERFACDFARGHFRLKQWGRVKITYELKQKQVSEYCIRKAMKEIDEEEYLRTLDRLAAAKWQTLRSETNLFSKLRKTQDYLLQKGYENGLIKEAVARLRGKAED